MSALRDSTVVAASPGARVVYQEDDGTLTIDDSVVAWLIHPEGEHGIAEPVTVGGLVNNYFGVIFPDGRVETSSGNYDSINIAQAQRKRA